MKFGSLLHIAALSSGSSYQTAKEIAEELINPTKLTHLFLLGDSRTANIGRFTDQNDTQIKWAGFRVPFNTLDTVGHDAEPSGIAGGNIPTPSPHLGGNINAWCPLQSYEVEFTGTDEPGSGSNATLSRCFYATSDGPSQANFPTFWSYVNGKAAKFRALAYRHAGAASSTPGIAAHWRGGGTNFGDAGNVAGSYVTDFTGTGYIEVSADIADSYAWGSYTTPSAELVAQPLTGTVLNETVAFVDAWFETTIGTVLHDWSVIGRSLDGFLDSSVFDPAMFSTLVPLYGENRIGAIALGTNNPLGNTQEQHETKTAQLISLFRVGTPGGSMILETCYAAATDTGGTTYYADACRSLAATVPGTLLVDTYKAMGDWESMALRQYFDVDIYTANGAHSASATSLVVNETISGTAASGTIYIKNTSGDFEEVEYDSWSGSTFTISAGIPSNVNDGDGCYPGDGVHLNDTGKAAYRETYGHLVALAAEVFVPTDIPGMFLGVYGDDTDITSAPDIDAANDLSAEGNDVSQALADKKPHDLVWRNGRNAFDMDGTDDFLERGALTGGAESQPYTTFDVFETPASTPASNIFLFGGDLPTNRGDVFFLNNDSIALYAGAQASAAATIENGTASILEVVWDSTNSDVRFVQHGQTDETSTGLNVGTHALNKAFIGSLDGGSSLYDAPIAGRFCYSGRLSPERRYVMRQWIQNYYAITPA